MHPFGDFLGVSEVPSHTFLLARRFQVRTIFPQQRLDLDVPRLAAFLNGRAGDAHGLSRMFSIRIAKSRKSFAKINRHSMQFRKCSRNPPFSQLSQRNLVCPATRPGSSTIISNFIATIGFVIAPLQARPPPANGPGTQAKSGAAKSAQSP
jgi:hypothetical protein